ncbi:MAG: hypothetical protein EOP83_29365, partial [Verrucomicrobiaceae bacterium]
LGEAEIAIVDDDQSFEFQTGGVTVSEGDRFVSLTIKRNGVTSGQVTVSYATSTSGGDALPGIDYAETSGTVTFQPGATSKVITIPIYSNLMEEAPETFFVTLSEVTGGATLGTQTTAQVTIVDEDPRPLEDLNGDGTKDLVFFVKKKSTLQVSFGNGDGTFGASTLLALGKGALSYTLQDMDGDGDIDIVALKKAAVANKKLGAVSVLLNNGNGTFASPVEHLVGKSVSSFVIADLNGDGESDIAVLNKVATTVKKKAAISVLLNNGTAGFTAVPETAVTKSTKQLIAGDFNGDGNTDLAANAGKTFSVLSGNGAGAFSAGTALKMPKGTKSLLAVDINSDAKTDILAITSTGAQTFLGGNALQPVGAAPILIATKPKGLALEDFNGDRLLDLASGAPLKGVTGFLLGDGNGGFTASPAVAKKKVAAGVVVVGDFNGDGRADLLTPGRKSSILLLSDGSGALQSQTAAIKLPFTPKLFFVSDVNA